LVAKKAKRQERPQRPTRGGKSVPLDAYGDFLTKRVAMTFLMCRDYWDEDTARELFASFARKPTDEQNKTYADDQALLAEWRASGLNKRQFIIQRKLGGVDDETHEDFKPYNMWQRAIDRAESREKAQPAFDFGTNNATVRMVIQKKKRGKTR
jgi:hypothetical protein